ncbi:L,D-transpeptidase [Amycolatopsis sp. FDAARGOS 1241]|uniref:L,D-transpeptidase family protein n=1 Tax=Amycolatopsis sp. FDAARGOS 1241 TaxID=2778070 RepID=UPI0019520BD0|nr:L,D-transpeptidase family protein [Amycolatopsis sp. FDAARGOS 1241]QRP48104.1 L,D-transpeptidase family protein [Amycolatopsis sp. FDAARGOS 1241]
MRTVLASLFSVALGTLGAGTANAPATPPPPALPYHGSADQMVTVTAPDGASTTATLIAWQRQGTHWTRVLGPFPAFVGTQGIGQASEATSHTPAGVWTLTEAFGIKPTNGTRLPYRQVTDSDWWVSDVKSPFYNTHYSCAPGTCPFDESAGEDLGKAGPVYDHATVIDYNRWPAVPGQGSAFFLHVSSGRPTAGCVSIPAAALDAVMSWLDPADHPVINIGISPQ